MKTLRVFPRQTKATPDDDDVRIGFPTMFDEADAIDISVAFTWDKPLAEKMADRWCKVAPVTIGGPAYNDQGGDFIPRKYLRHGYTITSRGCNNRCWFCFVWKRSGNVRELPIKDGWIIQDDNLLGCSESHIRSVFAMLKRQPHRPVFSGGLEARELKDWHIDLLIESRPQQIFLAYDTPDDLEPLQIASQLLRPHFNMNVLRCYVLIGTPNDTQEDAFKRLQVAWRLGFLPFSQLYRNEKGVIPDGWSKFHRQFCRPAITKSILKNEAIRAQDEI